MTALIQSGEHISIDSVESNSTNLHVSDDVIDLIAANAKHQFLSFP